VVNHTEHCHWSWHNCDKTNYTVNFGWHDCRILKGRDLIKKATKRDKLWILEGKTLAPAQNTAHITKASINTWHRQLDHAMTQFIRKLAKKSIVLGIEAKNIKHSSVNAQCIPYLKEKRTHGVIPKKSNVENPRRLHRIYSNVYGLFDVKGYSWCKYFVTFVDGFSYYIRVKSIRTKDKASKALMD